MMIQQRRFRLGQRVKLHDSTVEGGNAYHVRVLGDGKETTVFIVNIDSGWDEWVDGNWRERRSGLANSLTNSPAQAKVERNSFDVPRRANTSRE